MNPTDRFVVPSASTVINCLPSQTNWRTTRIPVSSVASNSPGSGNASGNWNNNQQQQPIQQQNTSSYPQPQQQISYEQQQLQHNQNAMAAQQQQNNGGGEPEKKPSAEWVFGKALFPRQDGTCSLCGSYASIEEVAGVKKPGMAYWKCLACPNKQNNGKGKMGNEHPITGYKTPTAAQQPQSVPQQQNFGGGNQGAVPASSLDMASMLLDRLEHIAEVLMERQDMVVAITQEIRGDIDLLGQDLSNVNNGLGEISTQLNTTFEQYEKIIKSSALRPAEQKSLPPTKRQRKAAPSPPSLNPSDEDQGEQ